jgi:hypothetical protein
VLRRAKFPITFFGNFGSRLDWGLGPWRSTVPFKPFAFRAIVSASGHAFRQGMYLCGEARVGTQQQQPLTRFAVSFLTEQRLPG